MRNLFLKIGLMVTLLFLNGALDAAQTNLGASQEAAPWLQLPTSARAAGMGEAFGAMGEDISTFEINPAGLVQLDRPQFLLTHNAWFQGVALEHFSGGMPLDSTSGFGISFDYLNLGSVDAFTLSGNGPVAAGTITPNSYDAGLGYALALNRNFDLGAVVKYIQQNLGSSTGGAAAGDVGLMCHGMISGLSFGVAVDNIGSTLQGAVLPTEMTVAAAYRFGPIEKVHSFNFDIDGDFALSQTQAIAGGAGLEYWYNKILALRAGDRFSDEAADTGLTGWTLGAGVNLGAFQLDYAFTSNGTLGNGNLVSLLVKLDQPAKPQLTFKEVEILDSLKRNIQFEFDKSDLTASFAGQLEQLAQVLLKRNGDRVILTGYTSEEGSPEHNQKLSERRAEVVREKLLSQGVSPSQVSTQGKGNSNPIAVGVTPDLVATNRRVEITIIQSRPGEE